MTEHNQPSFDIKVFLAGLTRRPGVYQMFDADGQVLYVGKAKNLKNRVASYFRSRGLNNKTVALVNRVHHVEVTVTNSETEALLLEQNLIKKHRPAYNILLRDDKSYPYIFLSDEPYPRLAFHRGARRAKGRYFGPYPNAGAVRESMAFLQKVFRVRQCENSVFNNRSRPCLQYQIGRCTGPCVALVPAEDYAEDVRHTELFLAGKSETLLAELADRMEAASARLEFEKAAAFRDRITALQRIREKQYIEGEQGDLDIIACAQRPGAVCVQVMYVRDGRILGSKSHYPRVNLEESPAEVLSAFIAQFYLGGHGRDIPREILLDREPADGAVLAEALASHSGHQVALSSKLRGNRARWVKLAANTAEQNCASVLANRDNTRARFEDLRRALGLDAIPQRIECFDISHSGGERTVASCVVFDVNGPVKSDYRRFNIADITPGDDYAAMHQALTRRYQRLADGDGQVPDLLVIDGGKGQMTQAAAVLGELAVNGVTLLGIAKGPTRKAGFEHIFVGEEQREVRLQATSSGLHLLQQIRDEAHRFAITGHKQRRDKARRVSSLEDIPGVGPRRRRELLRYFGGLQQVQRATVEELARVPGISARMADDIYATLHVE